MSLSWLSTSTVLLIVLVVVLPRAVRTLDRRRRTVIVAEVSAADITEKAAPVFPRDHVLLRQRTDMTSTPSPLSGPEASEAVENPSSTPSVRVPRPSSRISDESGARDAGIRWDRTAAALVSLAAVVLGLLTGVLATFTALPWTLPVFLLVIGVGGIAALRYLAVSDAAAGRGHVSATRASSHAGSDDRADEWSLVVETADHGRAEAERGSNLQDTAETLVSATASGRRSESGLFDQQAPERVAADAQRAEERLLQAGPLDLAGLAAAEAADPVPAVHDEAPEEPRVEEHHGSARLVLDKEMLREQARRVALGRPAGFTAKDDSWAPVQVPRPTYMDAPEAPRADLEPLRTEEPRSESSTLAEAAARGLNLNDVLSRRRA